MCVKCVNVKIFIKVEDEHLTFDLGGSKRRARIQDKWDARKQRARLKNEIPPSNKSKERKI